MDQCKKAAVVLTFVLAGALWVYHSHHTRVKSRLHSTLEEKQQRVIELDRHNYAKSRQLMEAETTIEQLRREQQMSKDELQQRVAELHEEVRAAQLSVADQAHRVTELETSEHELREQLSAAQRDAEQAAAAHARTAAHLTKSIADKQAIIDQLVVDVARLRPSHDHGGGGRAAILEDDDEPAAADSIPSAQQAEAKPHGAAAEAGPAVRGGGRDRGQAVRGTLPDRVHAAGDHPAKEETPTVPEQQAEKVPAADARKEQPHGQEQEQQQQQQEQQQQGEADAEDTPAARPSRVRRTTKPRRPAKGHKLSMLEEHLGVEHVEGEGEVADLVMNAE
jgi:hypothetical protein